jgi:hypothetical protein
MTPALKFVILRHPEPDDAFLRELVALREAGYSTRHGEVNVAADGYDPVSTHVAVCAEGGGLRPLMGFRCTSALDCAAAGLPFPLAALLDAGTTEEHAAAVADELEACRRAGRDATYLGMWTTDPALRRDRRLFSRVLRTMGALLVGLVADEGAGQLLAGGLPRLGTDGFLGGHGMRRMTHNGAELPAIAVPHIPGETAVLMRLETFSASALSAAAAQRAEWSQRLVLAPRVRARAA